MADAFDTVVDKVRKLSAEQRDELAGIIEDYVSVVTQPTHALTEEERKLVMEGLADFKAGRIATKEEVEAAYASYQRG